MKKKLIALSALSLSPLAFCADVTLPQTGVNVADYITAAITGLGGVVAVAVGGYVAFVLVKKGLRWLRWI